MVAVAGCGDPNPGAPTRLNIRSNLWVSDVPVPEGFRLNEGKSHAQVTARSRQIDHLYEGDEALTAVRNFYIEQMPQSDWKSDTEELNDGVYQLHFAKAKEKCQVQISRGGGLFNPTQIRVQINASANAAAKKTSNDQ